MEVMEQRVKYFDIVRLYKNRHDLAYFPMFFSSLENMKAVMASQLSQRVHCRKDSLPFPTHSRFYDHERKRARKKRWCALTSLKRTGCGGWRYVRLASLPSRAIMYVLRCLTAVHSRVLGRRIHDTFCPTYVLSILASLIGYKGNIYNTGYHEGHSY